MNLDDKSLFLDAMEDVQPLKRATDVHWHPTRNHVRRSVSTRCSLIISSPPISRHHPTKSAAGVSAGRVATWVLDKLRSGKYPQQASLNLLRQPWKSAAK
ncbi:Smr domain protein [Escherichia coli]|nr:Smr domain protein [Escherichia coli]